MKIQMFTVGKFYTNCYIIACEQTNEAIIVDPGFEDADEAEKILKFIEHESLNLKMIVNTHGHPDHTCGNGIIKERFSVPILIHKFDAHMLGEIGRKIAGFFGFEKSSPLADKLLSDGDLLSFGKIILRVMHTPGHSHGSISLLAEKDIFTGDTLFMGSIGRTDFPESSEKEMRLSLRKLAILPDNYVVYPGHGPTTTIGEEKRTNPFMQWL
jgi:glyoxylase-like metal-dependent hydrolase (beta-lactamase superfamily II)